MLDVRSCWLPSPAPNPGVTLEGFRQWEDFYGVVLPLTVKSLLAVHDGGQIERLGTSYTLLPLSQIRPLSEASMRTLLLASPGNAMEALTNAGVPMLWLIFPFISGDSHRVHLLCFPEHSIKSEPEVFIWENGTVAKSAQLVDDLITELIQLSDFPAVDLQEVATLEISADEQLRVPLDEPAGAICELRQVLGKRNGEWVLYTREVVAQDGKVIKERRTRAIMPASLQMRSSHVTQSRPAKGQFGGAWSLPIEPKRQEAVHFTHSQLSATGKWQSEELHGEPASFLIESTDEQRLCALRKTLLPPALREAEAAKEAKAKPTVAPEPAPAASPFSLVERLPTLPDMEPPPLPASKPEPDSNWVRPNVAAITESLRKMNDGAIRAPRKRLATA